MSMFGARFAVFARRARVLPGPCPATRNLSFHEVSPAPSPCCFNSLFHWTVTCMPSPCPSTRNVFFVYHRRHLSTGLQVYKINKIHHHMYVRSLRLDTRKGSNEKPLTVKRTVYMMYGKGNCSHVRPYSTKKYLVFIYFVFPLLMYM
jgi:hypothetical protein